MGRGKNTKLKITNELEKDKQLTSSHQNKIINFFSNVINKFRKPEPQFKESQLKEAIFAKPKLFGGSIEEYVQATGHDIPLVVKSCIKMLSLHGLHTQGIFRVPGSRKDINGLRDSFEKGKDPLLELNDVPNNMNSIAGVLKLYFRDLKTTLFPSQLFDKFIECSKLESHVDFIAQMKPLLSTLPHASYVVMRYLFSFLNHVSKYSDDNMMNAYNLAVCLGPTLLSIPLDRNLNQFLNPVIKMLESLIIYQDQIFTNDIEGDIYEKNDTLDELKDDTVTTERKFIYRSKSLPGDLNQLTNDENIRAIMLAEDERIFKSYFFKKDPISCFDPRYVG